MEDVFSLYCRRFEKLHPGLRVRDEYIPWGQFDYKLLTAMAARSGVPDVVMADRYWVGRILHAGGIRYLDNDFDEQFLSRFLPVCRKTFTFKGKLFAIPFETDYSVMFYRRDIVEPALTKLGMAQFPDNYEDFVALCREVSVRDESGETTRYAMELAEDSSESFVYHWVLPAGGRLMSEDYSKITFGESPAREAFHRYVAMIRDYKVACQFRGQRGNNDIEAYREGFFAMRHDGIWWANDLRITAPGLSGRWAIFNRNPFNPKGKPSLNSMGGFCTVIPSMAPNPQGAKAFIKYFFSESLLRHYTCSVNFTSDPASWPDLFLDRPISYFGGQTIYRAYADGAEYTTPSEFCPRMEGLFEILGRALSRSCNPDSGYTPDQALDKAVKEAEEMMRRDERAGDQATETGRMPGYGWNYIAGVFAFLGFAAICVWGLARAGIAPAQRVWRARISYLYVAPFYIIFLVFGVFTHVFSAYLSLCDWNGISGMRFIGLGNYRELLSDTEFATSIITTLKYTVVFVSASTSTGLLLAVALNQKIPARGFFRLFFYLPSLTTIVAIVFVFQQLYNPDFGTINQFLRWIGVRNPPEWLQDRDTVLWAVLGMTVWASVGWSSIFYLAGLQSIPETLYEAAYVDGANFWQRFRYVTVPMLTPITLFVVTTSSLGAFNVFSEIWLVTGGTGGPEQAAQTAYFYLYRQGFVHLRMGYASSVSFAMFFITLGLTLYLTVRTIRQYSPGKRRPG